MHLCVCVLCLYVHRCELVYKSRRALGLFRQMFLTPRISQVSILYQPPWVCSCRQHRNTEDSRYAHTHVDRLTHACTHTHTRTSPSPLRMHWQTHMEKEQVQVEKASCHPFLCNIYISSATAAAVAAAAAAQVTPSPVGTEIRRVGRGLTYTVI